MNCQDFEQAVTGLAAGQLMDAVTRERGLAHVAACARCHRRWRDEQVLNAGLRAFAAGTAVAEAPARLKQALRAAFDEQVKAAAPAVVVPFAPRWPRWALAAAAVALMTVGVTALLWLRAGTAPERVVVQATPSPAPPEIAPPPVAPPAGQEKVIAQRGSSKPVRRVIRIVPRALQPEPVATPVSEREVATQFIPLSYARTASQDGLVVRVEVSRASLIAMGLPLDVSRAEGNVKADLKVGIDGTPVAIRLLE